MKKFKDTKQNLPCYDFSSLSLAIKGGPGRMQRIGTHFPSSKAILAVSKFLSHLIGPNIGNNGPK